MLQDILSNFDFLASTLSQAYANMEIPSPGFSSNIQWTLPHFNIILSLHLIYLSVFLYYLV